MNWYSLVWSTGWPISKEIFDFLKWFLWLNFKRLNRLAISPQSKLIVDWITCPQLIFKLDGFERKPMLKWGYIWVQQQKLAKVRHPIDVSVLSVWNSNLPTLFLFFFLEGEKERERERERGGMIVSAFENCYYSWFYSSQVDFRKLDFN